MHLDRLFHWRVLAIAAALVFGTLELLALQRARITRWRIAHRGT